MDKHTTSRSGVADETKSRTTHTSTKPLTRPTAPRLSSSTRPTTISSAAKAAGAGSLSKPPARPSTTTVRRPPSASATPTTAPHQKRQSVSSVDERPSGDEKSRAGISARPKRASLAPSTSAERTSTLKTVAATPARRTTLNPSTTRQTVTSPSGARKVPSTPTTSRTTVASRSRPLTSTTSRTAGAGAIAEKKRLSTIPASPAVKTDVEEPEDNKENAGSQEEEKGQKAPVRPALGSRQSTRSVLIEQKIREFELVNTMLQAAMTADGVDGEEQDSIKQEASSTIAKLKSDLAKVRGFERIHGRLPTEEELEDAASVEEESEPKSPVKEETGPAESVEISVVAELQAELAQSKAYTEALQHELSELNKKLEDASQSAEAESRRVQETNEAIRAEYAAKIEELTSSHENKVLELESSHQKTLQDLHDSQHAGSETIKEQFARQLADKESEVERLRSELDEERNAASAKSSSKEAEVDNLRAELEELRTTAAKDQAAKAAEIEALKLDLQTKKTESETASPIASSPIPSPPRSQELADAQQKLEAAHARHLAAKENAKSKIARLQEDFENKVKALQTQHEEQIGELNSRLDQAEKEVANKQKELAQQQNEYAKISDEMTRQGQVIQTLKDQVLEFEQIKKSESDAQAALISQLQNEIQALRQEKSDEAAAAAASLEAAEKAHSEKIVAIEEQLNHVQEELKNAQTLHEIKLQEVLKKAADDLSVAKTELEESKASHTNKLQALEAELEKAKASGTSKQAEHDAAVSTLQKELDTAKVALNEAMTKHEALLKQHESAVNSSKDELAALKSSHAEELKRLRTEHQTKLREEIEALKVSHAERVQQLEEKILSSQKEISSLKETHASQIKQLEQQTKASLADLETLEAGYVEELNQVKAEAEQLQQKAAEEAELKHIERVRQLEQQLSAAEAAVSEVRSTYAKQLEDLERQNGLDQDTALQALKESHAGALQNLEDQLKSAREAAEAAEAEHEERLRQLEEQLSARHIEEVESLKASHAQKLEEMESTVKSNSEQAFEEVRSSLLEEKRQLESQVKSLQADVQGTRFQFQSMKGILQSMEEESKEKDEEHAAILEKMEQDLSTAVMKLAEQSARMMDLQRQHDQALAEAKKAITEQSKQDVETLRADHEKALADLRSRLETEHKQVVDKLGGEYATSFETKQNSHQSQLDEVQKRLKKEYDSQLDEVMKTLESQWKTQVDSLEEEQATASAQLAQAIKDHEEAFQAIKSEHEAAVASLQSQLEEARAAVEDTVELDGLRRQLADVQAHVKEIEQKHAEAMSALHDRESTLASLKGELSEAREALEHRPDTAEVEELNNKLVAAQKALEEFHEKHDQTVGDIKAEYEAKLGELKKELAAVKQATANAQVPDTAKLEAVTASFEVAKRTIASLEDELNGAMLEIETQRNLADEAKLEVEKLQQVQSRVDVVALPSPKPRRQSRSPKRKSMNPLSPAGPKEVGLESSKWASEPGQETATTDTTSTGQEGHAVKEEAATVDEHEHKHTADSPDRPAGTPGKRNVVGQLAGIQEQIKQLDELSEDFLEEHQNMAQMLSRVDDGTTGFSTVQVEEDETE